MTIMTVENNFSTSQSHRLKTYDQIYTISSVYMLCSIAFVHAALCDVLDGLEHPSLFQLLFLDRSSPPRHSFSSTLCHDDHG